MKIKRDLDIEELNSLYNKYKERLFKHFVSLNDDASLKGTNLLASKRYNAGTNNIHFGDTTIDMAYYITFLASDYYITKDAEILNRLKNALVSINRLDLMSKIVFDTHQKLELTGFFMRSDISDIELFSHCSNLLNEETFDGNILIDEKIIHINDSQTLLSGAVLERSKKRNVMSQDQFWHLFYGFAMVKKLVNDSFTNNIINDIVDRFLTYSLDKCNQVIKNPVTGEKVPRGADMRLYAYGFAKAGEAITGYKGKYTKMLHFWNKPLYKVAVFGAEFLYNMTKNIWGLSIKEYSYRSLGCISDLWWNKRYIKNLVKNFNDKCWYPHFVLSHHMLHDSNIGDLNLSKFERLLSSVPKDGQFYNFFDGDLHYFWSVGNSLVDPEYDRVDDLYSKGSYSAVDFLILHNLYIINYKPEYIVNNNIPNVPIIPDVPVIPEPNVPDKPVIPDIDPDYDPTYNPDNNKDIPNPYNDPIYNP